MTPTLLLSAVFSLLSPALAADSVSQVAAGTSSGTGRVQVAVWTSTSKVAPERVDLELHPFDGAPGLAGDHASVTQATASRQVWESRGVSFTGDARGAMVPARAVLLDAQARQLATVELPLAGGSLVCGDTVPAGEAGRAHAHLRLDEGGRTGTVALVLDEGENHEVASVSFELGAATAGATPIQRHSAAALTGVQQLWTAELDLVGAAGHRYQVDGVVVDEQGEPFGVSFTAELIVDSAAPMAEAPCPFRRAAGTRVASLR